MVNSYRVRRIVKIGDEQRFEGDLCPEAHTWFRVDHLVHAGFLTLEPMDDEEFAAGVADHCPELAGRLQDITGVDLSNLQKATEGKDEPTKPEDVPAIATRDELEAMELKELRQLAKDAGLETIKKAEIIDALAEPEQED